MKRLNKTLLSLLILGFSTSMSAQQLELDHSNMREGESVEYCTTHKKMMEMLKDPAKLKIWQAEQAAIQKSKEDGTSIVAPRGVVYKIPIVFHVLHNGGTENISSAQIMDALDILNTDFRLQNADANNVVTDFQGMPADSEIEFVLATKAPDGTCFSGITRTQDALSDDGSSGFAQVNAIQSGNDVYNGTWREKDYLNIFIANEIGGAAGYTYNPFGGGTGMSGIWILDEYVGAIGTGTVGRSRALTHEVGHWLNLSHTWGPNNNPGNASSCGDDDGVNDTPNTIGVTACILGENTCGPVANVENYMDYSYCSKMYTQGQVDRMRNSLNSNSGGRNNLWTTANLTARGANGNPALCAADFQSNVQVVCTGSTIDFTDESYHGVTGWDWTFTGGSPASATTQNPTITYNTPGTYAVELEVTNGTSSISETKTSYITVLPTGRAVPFTEGFETLSLPDEDWVVDNPDGANGWAITSSAGATGSKSLKLNNTTNDNGDIDEFVSGNIDLTTVTDFELSFKYAFAKKQTANTDYLRVYASSDCGESWSVRKNISASNIATASNTTSAYTPSSADWETVTITNIVSSYWTENFRFKFQFVSGGGNNVYIDDINLYDPSVPADTTGSSSVSEIEGINFFKVYPNPTNGITNISLNSDNSKNIEIEITDMIGKKVMKVYNGSTSMGTNKYTFNSSQISKGVYFINVITEGRILSKKLIIE
jgi:PKD repeat protein